MELKYKNEIMRFVDGLIKDEVEILAGRVRSQKMLPDKNGESMIRWAQQSLYNARDMKRDLQNNRINPSLEREIKHRGKTIWLTK